MLMTNVEEVIKKMEDLDWSSDLLSDYPNLIKGFHLAVNYGDFLAFF